jgi:tetratricopeptide (TPR) repeat protein
MLESRYRNLMRQFAKLHNDNRPLVLDVADVLADWSYQSGHWTDMLRIAERALEVTPTTDIAGRARFLFESGAALNALGRADEAIPMLESSLALARNCSSFETATLALIALGASKREQERFAEAIGVYDAAYEEAELAPRVTLSLQRLILSNKGVALREIGEPELAQECQWQARVHSIRLRDRHGLATALVNLSQISLDLHQFRLAGKYASRGYHFAIGVGAQNVAMAQMESGNWQAAQRALDLYRGLAEAQESAVDLAKHLHNVGWLHHLSGDDVTAEQWLRRAVEAKSHLPGRASLAVAFEDLAEVLHALADRAGSTENWAKAIQVFEEIAPSRAVKARIRAKALGIDP